MAISDFSVTLISKGKLSINFLTQFLLVQNGMNTNFVISQALPTKCRCFTLNFTALVKYIGFAKI